MEETQNYINETLGVGVDIKVLDPVRQKNLPLFIRQLYDLYQVEILGRDIILLRNKSKETTSTDNLRKHAELTEQVLNYPVVFVLPFLLSYNRRRLIQKHVAFIVPGKQMFIPQLLIDLRDYRTAVSVRKEKLLPAAQCILFYHLLKENLELFSLKTIAEKLNYTQATVTRSVQALVEKDLVQKEVKNKHVHIRFKGKAHDVWQKALPFLQNPVKKIYYSDQIPLKEFLYDASFTALSHYTNLADAKNKFYAVAEKDFQKLKKEKDLHGGQPDEGEIVLQVWKYSPGILADNKIVDPLSLYLTLKDEKDERVEMALKKMIERIW